MLSRIKKYLLWNAPYFSPTNNSWILFCRNMEESSQKGTEDVSSEQIKTVSETLMMKPPTPVLKVEREGNCYWYVVKTLNL